MSLLGEDAMTAKKMRKIINIDEGKCNGCGQCVLDCAEGAIEIIDGKAKLVGEIFCDGLGACLSGCPTGALTIEEREAEDFDEAAVHELLENKKAKSGKKPLVPLMECGCPSSQTATLKPARTAPADAACGSALGHWPVKLRLVQAHSPFLKDADLVLLADCAACAYPALHADLLPGKAVVMGCPKFDDPAAYIEKLASILKEAKPKSLTVAIMEVPCCGGFGFAAQKAIEASGVKVPAKVVTIARSGEILEQRPIA